VLLFDEVEKARPDVWNVLLQVLDDGRLTDGQGRTVDFRNTVIILTSNVGSHHIMQIEDEEKMRDSVMNDLRAHFRPEFINRLDEIVVFHRLKQDQLRRIVDIQLVRFAERLASRGIGLDVTDEAKDFLAEVGYDPTFGARPLKRAIQRHLENRLAEEILAGRFTTGDTVRVDRSVAGELVVRKIAADGSAHPTAHA
jgi:ATP-dependent Clp protease ATP-binding subunit ClpB